ncbi:hypothetical protein ABPG72_006717 [Tetrahymena utriculariae]
MNQNGQHIDAILRKYPWYYCEEWDLETFKMCIEQLGISDQRINQININKNGVQNILNYIEAQDTLKFLREERFFIRFKQFYSERQIIQESQKNLLQETNYSVYKYWDPKDLQKFINELDLNINQEQHNIIINRNPSSLFNQLNIDTNTQDCKIYKQWIKYIKDENDWKIEQKSEQTQLLAVDEINIEFNKFIRLYTSMQTMQGYPSIFINTQITDAISNIHQNVKIYVVKQDCFNVSQEQVNSFQLSSNNQTHDLGLVQLKTLVLRNRQNIEQSFLHLKFKTLQNNLYYQIFTEKLVVGDEILISQSLIHITVIYQKYEVETQTMSYTLMFRFESDNSNLICEVEQKEGEQKILGRYLTNNSNDIFHFNQIQILDLKHFSRDFALLEVKNQNLYIRWNHKKEKQLWKRIKQNNMILLQPFINIKCSTINSFMILQGFNNVQSENTNQCEHQNDSSTVEMNQVSKSSNYLTKLKTCLLCSAKYFQINHSQQIDDITEENPNNQITDLIDPNDRYFFNVKDDNVLSVSNFLRCSSKNNLQTNQLTNHQNIHLVN